MRNVKNLKNLNWRTVEWEPYYSAWAGPCLIIFSAAVFSDWNFLAAFFWIWFRQSHFSSANALYLQIRSRTATGAGHYFGFEKVAILVQEGDETSVEVDATLNVRGVFSGQFFFDFSKFMIYHCVRCEVLLTTQPAKKF